MENRERKGQMLKQAREAKRLSLQTVHDATKIPMDILRALEEGYTVRTLTPFYYKGFIKIYAQYLNMDLKDFIEDYSPEKLPHPVRERKYSLLEDEANYVMRKQRIRLLAKVIIIAVGIFFLVKITGCIRQKVLGGRHAKHALVNSAISSKRSKSTKKKRVSLVSRRKKEPILPVVSKSNPTAGVSETLIPEDREKAKNARNINVTVRAQNNSWLRVVADGTVVFQSTLTRGAVETWRSDKKIEISGRNINQLEIEFNGKLIGSLGREKRRIRRVIFTSNGLSVLK